MRPWTGCSTRSGESGRLDNTLIVFMSDNGYAWGEHRLQGKNTPYDASVRVPLVMRYDGTLAAGPLMSASSLPMSTFTRRSSTSRV